MALASQQQCVYLTVRESPAEKQLSEGLKVRALSSPGFTSLWDRAAHAPLGAAWAHCKGPLFEGALQKTTCVCVCVCIIFFPLPCTDAELERSSCRWRLAGRLLKPSPPRCSHQLDPRQSPGIAQSLGKNFFFFFFKASVNNSLKTDSAAAVQLKHSFRCSHFSSRWGWQGLPLPTCSFSQHQARRKPKQILPKKPSPQQHQRRMGLEITVSKEERKSTPQGTEVGEKASEGRVKAEPSLPRRTWPRSSPPSSEQPGTAGRHQRGVSAKKPTQVGKYLCLKVVSRRPVVF